MEKKKTVKADLENKKGLFLQIGLVVSLGIVLAAFEWKTFDALNLSDLNRTVVIEEEEIIIQTEQNQPPPPPPPPEITTELNIVDDETEIETELEISVEIDERTEIQEYVAPVDYGEAEEEGEQTIFQVVEENPGFPGGEAARQKYLQDNLRYPAIARESGIQGTIYITFVVERDGSITDVRVVRGIGGGCDEEAIRVVQGMPRWTPGKQRGRAVRVQFMMPIRFTLAG